MGEYKELTYEAVQTRWENGCRKVQCTVDLVDEDGMSIREHESHMIPQQWNGSGSTWTPNSFIAYWPEQTRPFNFWK